MALNGIKKLNYKSVQYDIWHKYLTFKTYKLAQE